MIPCFFFFFRDLHLILVKIIEDSKQFEQNIENKLESA